MEYSRLKRLWHIEVLGGPDTSFSWLRLWRRVRRSRPCHYLFWFRFADYLARKNNRTLKSFAKGINNGLISKHGTEIMLGAEIDEGLVIGHGTGIVITKAVRIGKHFTIRQNTTIGTDYKSDTPITIGDYVDIGANSCIIGSDTFIGDHVTIGAMSFVNKSIPSHHTYITDKTSRLIPKG
ncbi:serine acetyltransferase [Pseudomonas sp. EL_65y_Pfl2_R95]|uniref:serine acetyltransferase n=1 Tax=Pseudomonas sp. EL_65y_Pfl2_R95 TaxID=3088698 RepID=UPI0030DD89C7